MDERVSALESSVSELKSRVRRAEDDAAAARHLASGADRDTAEIRGELREFRTQNNRVLTALRADLTDGFAEMRRGFASAAVAQHQIVELLDLVVRQRDDGPEA